MSKRKIATSLLILQILVTTGCATVMQGTSQVVTFKLDPKTASCDLSQQGKSLGSVSDKIPTIEVGKSKHDILVRCSAPGFEDYQTSLASEASKGGVGSVFLFDLGITDLATGAFWKYPEIVSIVLKKPA
jgi:hypothetical protein